MEFNLFGIHRSGTYYLTSLIGKNFNGIKTNIGRDDHKHILNKIETSLPTFIIYKPVYQWVESIVIRKPIFCSYVNSLEIDKSRMIYPDNSIKINDSLCDIVRLVNTYRQFYENWVINNKNENLFVIRYIDLLQEDKRNKILNDINDRFNFQHDGEFINVDWGFVKLSNENYRKENDYHEQMLSYYLNDVGLQLDEYTKNSIDQIITNDFKQQLLLKTNLG